MFNFPSVHHQYTAATRSNNVDTIARSIEALSNLLKRDPKLGAALSSPTLKTAEKKAIAAELRKQIGDRGGDTMRNFLDTLAENNRLSQLLEVCQKFLRLTSAAKGEVEVTVTSAAVCSLEPSAIEVDGRPKFVKN